jgi:peptide/nickel transport system ATP-binding protein
MKQRVVIAMALACSPELLLADEPTTALDVTIQAQVLEMINKLKKDFNTSMIMISHNLGVVAEVCDDLAVIYAGNR